MHKYPLPVLLLFACSAWAQAVDRDREPAAIVELGGAASWNFNSGASAAGAITFVSG